MKIRFYTYTAADGRRYTAEAKRSWDHVYHSFDGGRTWSASRFGAFNAARDAGLLQLDGTIRIIQEGQPDKFEQRNYPHAR
jgi:hypothetical protein